MKTTKIQNNKNRFLFAIDLDGTTLQSSRTGEIHEVTIKAVQRAVKEGHIVCILTGRPWRSTQEIYKTLNLNTVVVNYNGAHIHNPLDKTFIPHIKYLNLNEALYILGDDYVKNEISNLVIEGPDWVQLQRKDVNLEAVFSLHNTPKKRIGLDFFKIPLQPTGVLFDVKETTDPEKLRKYLKTKFSDLAEFSYWSKGEGLTPVFDITSLKASKGKALSMLMRYYDISIENTIAIGDSFNDVSMFKIANLSVAMQNADKHVKKYATIKINHNNKNGGVGHWINAFLDNPEKEIERSNKRKEKILSVQESDD
ncbi:Cof-type HAD-IIB family hydrolase [Mycoplasmopsis synoviae]|uniref:Cof-type HAD-IIB family hydrolase n=1 Tax=Mycoplasmopsis synoviae TaxID=2109 RepID=UPI001CE0F7C1|nr:Cof-type HAD-IIB family hydrolase [Mycoplasmopsis synoviae]UBX98247.1 Cof-type HAD-IIB family hydrolase [Mycoplasmopsis synoviae]